MIEAGANEVDNETMLEAIAKGHEEIKNIDSLSQMYRQKSANRNLPSNRRR